MATAEGAASGVRFGLFDWIDRGSGPLHDLYEDRLRLVQAADAAGFSCYHLAEHHATPLGMAPSPSLFLTAAAQRTERIRLGPLVYLLPLYDPLRLIEEVCMLDQLSAGRLELGIGRGVSPYELGYFGVDPDGSREIFNEVLSILIRGMTSDRLTFEGKHFHYRDVPMELRPYQLPYPPLWYPTHNPESVQQSARQGFNFVGLGPAEAVGALVSAYRQTWDAHREDPNRMNGHVARPTLGIVRQVVVADSDAEALALARAAHSDWYRPSPNSGTTTTITAWTACSLGRRRSSSKPSSTARPAGSASRWPTSSPRAGATTSSARSLGERYRMSDRCTRCNSSQAK